MVIQSAPAEGLPLVSQNSPLWRRYGVAVLTVGIIAFLRTIIPWEPGHFAYIIFIISVLCSAWYGGFSAGMLATVLGAMISNYYFLEGGRGVHWERPLDRERIIVYLLICVMCSFIIARLHAARHRAEENERKLLEQIAERAQVEESLRREVSERARIEGELKQTLARAESANIAKSSFLANMSHEIRTPMNAVVGISSILGMPNKLPPEKLKELVRTLQLSAQSMMSLIDDLLDITKIENDYITLDKESFDLRAMVHDVIQIMSVRAEEKNISLTLECDVPVGIYVGPKVRIRQVLINLLGNAVKFTETGGVILKVYAADQTGGVGQVAFEIRDTGIGIPEDKFDSIFQKFSQADTSVRRKFGGTGLGLAISRRLVEIMEGRITVSSTLGQGSVFKVLLPLGLDGMQSPHMLEARDAISASSVSGDQLNVLLVEDYQPNILIATFILDELGCRYEIAKNGHEAVAYVQKQRFNLILMDIQMPEMDGYEATQRIREYEMANGLPPIPVIGVSAHAFSEDRTRSLSVGMDDYISKPFSHADLKSRILFLLNKEQLKAG